MDGKWVRRTARTAADSVGATDWLEMGGEKKPLEISELGCTDGCGRPIGGENCADVCGRRGCQGVAGNGWGEEAAGDQRAWLRGWLRTGNGCGELRGRLRTAWVQKSGWTCVGSISELGCADGCGREMGAENCVDGCGRRGCQGVAGNGWGKEAAGHERAWLRGRLRKGNGCGELRGRLRTAWVQGVAGNGWGEEAAVDERGRLRTGNGCGELRGWLGAREWLEMGREKKPLVMSELGCADGSGRQMGGENCADGCGRRGCEGVAGNGWGEEGGRQMGAENCADG